MEELWNVYILYSDSDFGLQRCTRIVSYQKLNFNFVKNVKNDINFVPIKIVGFSHLVCSSKHRFPSKEEKTFFKHTARIRETHDAKPTMSFAYKTRTFAYLFLCFPIFSFLFLFFATVVRIQRTENFLVCSIAERFEIFWHKIGLIITKCNWF